MAQEEISSLLLKVGVDFDQLEQFVAAMPVIVDVAAAVGQELNSLQIGNPDVFQEKGAALTRALVAGFQSEALGLQFGGASLASVITERVFGDTATLGAVSTQYVRDVQRVLDNVRLRLPELGQPLISQQALNSLGSVGSLAGQSRRELEGMSQQLDNVLSRLAVLSNVQIPKAVLRRTADGGAELTPGARRAAESLGAVQQPRLIARNESGTQLALAASERATAQLMRDTLAIQQREAQEQQAALRRRISSRILDSATSTFQAPLPFPSESSVRSAEAQARRDRLREQRAQEAAERQARANELIRLFRGETDGVGLGQSIANGPVGPLTRDGSRFFTPNPQVALTYAQMEQKTFGIGGPTGRLMSAQYTRAELEAAGALRTPTGPPSSQVVLGPDLAARARTVMEGTNEQLRRYGAVLGAYVIESEQAALPRGTGSGPRDFGREDRAGARLARIAALRERELLENGGPGFRGSGLELGGPENAGPRLSSFDRATSARVVSQFVRQTNEDILRGLDASSRANSATGSAPELDPGILLRTLGASAFDSLVSGRGLGPQQRLSLTEEQRTALGDNNSPTPTGRLFPPQLIDRAQAIRELTDPNALGAIPISPVSRFDRRAITAGSPFDPALAPVTLDSRADQLAREARAAAVQRENDRSRFASSLSLTPALPPPVTGPPPSALEVARLREEAAFRGEAARRARNTSDSQAAVAAQELSPSALADLQRLGIDFQANANRALGNAVRAELAHAEAAAALARAEQRLAVEIDRTTRSVGTETRGALPFVAGAAGPARASTSQALEVFDPAARQQRLQLEQAARQAEDVRRRAVEEQRVALQRALVPPSTALVGTVVGGGSRGGVPPLGPFPNQPFLGQPGPTPAAGGAGAGGRGFGGGFGGVPPIGPFPAGGGAAGPPPPRGGGGASGPLFGGNLGSFFAGARTGLLGDGSDTPDFLGRAIGSALKFSIVYGGAYAALRLFTTAFGAGIQGAIQFETALTDLNIATEQTGRSNEALAFQLANVSSQRGFSSAEGVAAGARAIGLFGATDSSREDQVAIANVSTDVATKVAFLSGQTIEQVQTQLAGITRSFDVDPLQQERIFDVASFVGRRSGRPAGELLQSLGQIGSLGGDAGFSLEQTAAIIARLTSTTGQTPQAVSGFLSQVLSRADDPRLQQRLRAVGVETEGTTLAQQIEELSQLNLDQAQKNQIVSGFGRGRSGQALGIILEQFPEIQGLAEGAANADGIGSKDFEQAVNNIGGQLRVFASSLKDLFTGLAQTGVLDIFVGLLSASQGLVDVLDLVVDVFNLIPREARTAAFALLEVAGVLLLLSKLGPVAALAANARLNFGTALVANAAGAGAAGAGAAGAATLTGSRSARIAATGAGLAGAAGGFIGSGATALGGAVGGLGFGASALTAGLLTGGVGLAVLAVGTGIVKAINEAGAVDDEVARGRQAVFEATDEAGFDNARSQLQRARKSAEERDDFKLLSKDSLTLGLANVFDEGGAKQAKADVDEALVVNERRRKIVEAARESSIDTSPGAVFDGFQAGTESVQNGLSQLTERGFTATRQLEALNQAFDAVVSKSGGAADAVGLIFAGQIGQFTLQAGSELSVAGNDFAARQLTRSNEKNEFESGSLSNQVFGGIGSLFRGGANDIFRPGEEGKASLLGTAFGAFNEFNPSVDNSREQAKKLREGGEDIQRVLGDAGTQDRLAQSVTDVLVTRGKDPALGAVTLTEEDRRLIIEARKRVLEESLGEKFDRLPQDVQDAFFAETEKAFTSTLGAFNGTTVTASTAGAFLASVRQLAATKGQEIALLTGDQVAGAESTLQELSASRSQTQGLLDAASDPGERTAFARVLELLDLDIARATQDAVTKRATRIDALAALEIAEAGGDPVTTAIVTIRALNEKLAGAVDEDQALGIEAELVNQGRALRGAQAGVVSARERAAVDPRDSLGGASAAVRAAERALAVATPGSAEFYDAVTALRQAQKGYADAQTEAAVAQLFDGIDPRDTLKLADANVEAARLRLRAARRGLPGAAARTDFDNEGRPVGTVDPQARGFGQGQSFLKGVEAAGFAAKGALAGAALARGFLLGVGGAGTGATGGAAGGAAAGGALAGASLATTAFAQQAGGGGGSSGGGATGGAAGGAAYGGSGGGGSAPRRGVVTRGRVDQLATSGRFAPKPGQQVLGNNALIDLLLARNVGFGRLDGTVVPRATADGGISSHSFGNALDIFGTEAELDNIVKQLAPLVGPGKGLSELLFTGKSGPGTYIGKNGKSFKPSRNVVKNHVDHIHAVVNNAKALGGASQTAAGVPGSSGGAGAAEIAELQRQEAQAVQDRRQARLEFDIAKIEARTDPNSSSAQARAGLQIANRRLKDALPGTAGFYQALTGVRAAQLELANMERERANSKDLAQAVKLGGPVSGAAAALRVAVKNLKAQAPSTNEYFVALAELYRAQQELAEAQRQAAANTARLGIDITDPVAEAAIAVRTARRKQRENIARGADKDVRNQDTLDLRAAEASLEQSVFDQRLDRARTDAELGRTSQQAYLEFLRAEEKRLGSIAKRTVQQQAQYDQIQRELKGLNAQLTGQFNLGEIKVPTPFEVRRALAEREAKRLGIQPDRAPGPFKRPGGRLELDPASSQQGVSAFGSQPGTSVVGSSQVVNVTINGNDTNAMMAVLSQYLGASAFQRTSVSNTKIS